MQSYNPKRALEKGLWKDDIKIIEIGMIHSYYWSEKLQLQKHKLQPGWHTMIKKKNNLTLDTRYYWK